MKKLLFNEQNLSIYIIDTSKIFGSISVYFEMRIRNSKIDNLILSEL